jgi:CheY-like chemotaxis protein
MRALLVQVLRLDGYSVDAYGCGNALIEGLLEMSTSGRTPNLMLCDFDVSGRSALAVLQMLRGRGLNAPIVLTSSFVSEELLRDAFARGVSVVLSKPFSMHDLRRVVRCLMSGSEFW